MVRIRKTQTLTAKGFIEPTPSKIDPKDAANYQKRSQVESHRGSENQLAGMVEEQHLGIAGLHDPEHREHYYRQQPYDHPAHPGLRGQCANLREQALAGAADIREPGDNLP